MIIVALGHGKDGVRVLATEADKNNPFDEDVLKAETSSGECVLGSGDIVIPSSVHEIKVELNKMKAQKITMTLDCCRTVTREEDVQDYVVDLR